MKINPKFTGMLIITVGLGILGYPFISNWLYDNATLTSVETYNETVQRMDIEKLEKEKEKAAEYNESLLKSTVTLKDPFEVEETKNSSYWKILSIDNNDVISYIEIPSINVYLPVYHGTSSKTLNRGAGHMEGSSLPIGGTDTHCLISAHTGMRGAKMFTDLVDLETGDMFYIYTLGEKLSYKVDNISVVNPEDVSKLGIITGHDYVTLITCTPYGVNSHRLLVRGERITLEEEKDPQTIPKHSTSLWMKEYVMAITCSIGIVCIIVIMKKVGDKR